MLPQGRSNQWTTRPVLVIVNSGTFNNTSYAFVPVDWLMPTSTKYWPGTSGRSSTRS